MSETFLEPPTPVTSSRPGNRSPRSPPDLSDAPPVPRITSKHAKPPRSPNDVRVAPASTEVISNLLSSLSGSPLPDEPPPQSLRRSRRSVRTASSSVRTSSSLPRDEKHSPFYQDHGVDLPEIQHPPPVPDIPVLSNGIDAAEAPIIRTSRRPSGMTKPALQSPRETGKEWYRRKWKSGNEESRPSTSDENKSFTMSLPSSAGIPGTPILKDAEYIKKKRASKRSKEEMRSPKSPSHRATDSLEVAMHRENKGKGRAVDSSHSGAAPSPTILRSPNGQSPRPRSPQSDLPLRAMQRQQLSPTLPIQHPDRPTLPPPRNPERRKSQLGTPQRDPSPVDFVQVRQMAETEAPLPRMRIMPNNDEISLPSRGSSLRNRDVESRSIASTRRSSRSSLKRNSSRPPEIPTEEVPPKNNYRQSLNAEEGNDILRRIRELRAAKEERQQGLQHTAPVETTSVEQTGDQLLSSLQSLKNSRPQSLAPMQPASTIAAQQIAEASQVKEVSIKPDASQDQMVNGGVSPPSRPRSPSLAADYVNFSRTNPAKASPSLPAKSSDVPPPRKDSLPEPLLTIPPSPPPNVPSLAPVTASSNVSRPQSRSKRWSQINFTSSHQRHRSTTSTNNDKSDNASLHPPPSSDGKSLRNGQQPLGSISFNLPPPVPQTLEESVMRSVRDYVTSSRLSQLIEARDGTTRKISFSEVGDKNGHAVFCCVGMGLTRFVTAFYEELATTLRLRLITLERPGVGNSDAYADGNRGVLFWPDDIRAVCAHLSIRSFSLFAHSAGAIYALATALSMPSHVRGRIHLLAPWVPLSQLSSYNFPSNQSSGRMLSSTPSSGTNMLPKGQRFLRLVPTSFLKFTNAGLFVGAKATNGNQSKPRKSSDGTGTASATPRGSVPSTPMRSGYATPMRSGYATPLKSGYATPSKSGYATPSKSGYQTPNNGPTSPSRSRFFGLRRGPSFDLEGRNTVLPSLADVAETPTEQELSTSLASAPTQTPTHLRHESADDAERRRLYDSILTPELWALATQNSNPTIDLLTCLERQRPIGFRYGDITRPCVLHHGSKDSRVPLDNVKRVAASMRAAELRVLEGEGHGLLGNAGLVASVLSQLSEELETLDREDDGRASPASPILE